MVLKTPGSRPARSGSFPARDGGHLYGGANVLRKVEGGGDGGYTSRPTGRALDELRIAARLGSARNRGLLRQILVSAERSGWNAFERSGALNPADIARSQTGDQNVFRRRWIEEGISTTVSILVDGSSSMNGEEMSHATAMAYVLADVTEKCGQQSEVAVFRDTGQRTAALPVFDNGWRPVHRRWYGSNGDDTRIAPDGRLDRAQANESSDGATCDLFLVQERGERLSSAPVLDRFLRMFTVAWGGTPDFAGTMGMVLRLARSEGDRKILFVVTDGCGNKEAMKWIVSWAKRKFDIDVIGVGIGSHTAVYLKEQYRLWTAASIARAFGTGPGAGQAWSAFASEALALLVKQARTYFKARRAG
jgi:hypothetical protein